MMWTLTKIITYDLRQARVYALFAANSPKGSFEQIMGDASAARCYSSATALLAHQNAQLKEAALRRHYR